jgi:hypothetical protein
MVNKQQIFDECRGQHPSLKSDAGAASIDVLKNAFACMAARLEKEKATDDERRVFIEVIAQAIQGDPAMALPKYERDKVELQKVLRAEFAGTAYALTEPLAAKFSFLSLVHF